VFLDWILNHSWLIHKNENNLLKLMYASYAIMPPQDINFIGECDDYSKKL
jgi:hypothetical protein